LSNAGCPNLSLEHDGYVVELKEIGGGDYIDIEFCLDCGTLVGDFPISDERVLEAFNNV